MKVLHIKEIWEWVVGFLNYYKVSTYGRVKSISRIVPNGQGFRKTPCKILVPSHGNKGKGYPKVVLCKKGKLHYFNVPILVLIAFKGPRPPGMECCHKDDNPLNNHVDNLYWGTRDQNREDAIRNGKILFGDSHPRMKFTDENVFQITQRYKPGNIKGRRGNKFQLAKEFGTTGGVIYGMVRSKRAKRVLKEKGL
jgi:hypothetical protein